MGGLAVLPHKVQDLVINLDIHDGVFFPALSGVIPVYSYALHYGMGSLNIASEDLRNGQLVLVDGQAVVSKGHTAGLIGPHIATLCMPPATLFSVNLFMGLLYLNSSSKCIFASNSVISLDGPLAAAALIAIGFNLGCWDPVPVPLSMVPTYGTVFVGFTWADFFLGVIDIAVAIVIAYLLDKIAEGLVSMIPQSFKKKIFLDWARQFGEGNMKAIYREADGRFASLSEAAFDAMFQPILEDALELVLNPQLPSETLSESDRSSSTRINLTNPTQEFGISYEGSSPGARVQLENERLVNHFSEPLQGGW